MYMDGTEQILLFGPNLIPSKPRKTGAGGARPGAGRPFGSKSLQTREMLEAKKQLQGYIALVAPKLVAAQLSKALGESYLYCKRGGNVSLITDPVQIAEYLATEKVMQRDEDGNPILNDDGEPMYHEDAEFFYITSKSGDNQAITNMLDRAFGRPTEIAEIETAVEYSDQANEKRSQYGFGDVTEDDA
jgi:hypothetical protein